MEYYAGPGGVTRALLELPRSEVKRIIVVEEELKYLKVLKVRLDVWIGFVGSCHLVLTIYLDGVRN